MNPVFNNSLVVAISGAVFMIIIICVFYFAFKGSSTSTTKSKKIIKKTTTKKQKSAKKTDDLSLDDLIKMAKESTSSAELGKLCMLFINSEVLPIKTTAKLSADANHKLSFVSAVCSNRNAEPKTIAFLIAELEKRYPSYAQELEMYQNMGLAKRKMRY